MFFNFLFSSLITLLLLSPRSTTPPLATEHIETIAVSAGFSMTDALGNIYWANKSGLWRYEPATSHTLNYNNPRHGEINFVDTSDPLNIIVFYKHSGIIEFLDNKLSPKEIPSGKQQWLDTGIPSVVAGSSLQGFWAFFTQSMSIKRFDLQFREQASTDNIQQQLPSFTDPVFMTESQNQVFVGCSNGEIFVFDSFGNFIQTISGIETQHFQVEGNNIFYFTSNEIRIFNFVKSSETVYLLPKEEVQRGFVKGQHLVLQTLTGIDVYLLKQNIF